MSLNSIQIVRRSRSLIFVCATLVAILGVARPATAQWRSVDAQNAWNGYNNAFLHLEPDGYSKVFVTTQGGTTAEDFWRQAEEIEVAIDAYYENPTTANKNEVQALCDGFVNYIHPATNDNWSSDNYNDDLGVAIIAFARAYAATGTTRWLSDAETNFNVIWNRAQAGDGGLCQNKTLGCYENSSANWTFIIAGRLIDNYNGHTGSYKSEANGVYTWALGNLYQSSTGQIYDAKGGVTGQYTYNYGFAIGAMNEEGASAATIGSVANYVFNDLTNYAGTSGGYNILPNYGQGNLNDSGFNGILMRWIGVANGHGLISSTIVAAAQANMNKAWSERNGTTTLVWNDWVSPTPSTGTYSWDDCAAMAGLLDIPPTA